MGASTTPRDGQPDPAGAAPDRVISRARTGVYYAVLVAVTAVVMTIVIAVGTGEHAQPTIAGGYDVTFGAQCLGPKIDVGQSGQFVTIGNAQGTLSGDLTFKGGELSGTVHCTTGASTELGAHFVDGRLAGAVLGNPMLATLKRDPPAAGTPKPRAPGSIAGTYSVSPSSACLGSKFVLAGSGAAVKLSTASVVRGLIHYHAGVLEGRVACSHGGSRTVTGTAAGRSLDLMLIPPATPAPASPVVGAATPEHVTATLSRTPDQTVVAFFVALLVVMLFARLCGSLMPRLRQPRVMGEVLAGIILGPTVFGAIDPGLQTKIFATDIVPIIGVAANLGLIFYMFLIGLEVDFSQLRGRLQTTLAVSNTGLAVPMMLGMASALPLYHLLGPNKKFVAFALFMGVSMSVTAFPVLARIVSERRMLQRPIGILALSAAAVDDVSAWFLIALATAVAGAGTGVDVLEIIGWTTLFGLVMAFAIRPVLARAAVAYDEAGSLPGTWITIIFAGVVLAAVVTDTIGVAVIFGAFVMGLMMPRHAGLSHEVTRRVEDFVLTLLLPLFFAYTGLRTDIGALGQGSLILITLGLIAIAIAGKYGGTLIAARSMRLPWKHSFAIGALMNTRGLTELIVLNLALDQGAITPALFTALVVMALVTTFMTGPMMRLIDPTGEFSGEPEEELAAAERLQSDHAPAPSRSILVAPQSDGSLGPLLSIAAPLAHSEPPRELILARLIPPPRGSTVRGGLQTERRLVREASDQLQRERLSLFDFGIASRAVALASAHPGRDLARLAASSEVDLVLLDGRRPLLGDGVPREDVGVVLSEAPCDVAVLVARDGTVEGLDAASSVIVPFGGAEHDWAALELASWLCATTGASLELLGPPGQTDDGKDASHMLANAALLVQQFAGVSASGTVGEPGRDGLVAAAARASLLVIGLSDRWRQEGLGETRRELARSAPAPIVFVRRGERPGALAPSADVTRFGWSSPAVGMPRNISRAFSRSFSRASLPRISDIDGS